MQRLNDTKAEDNGALSAAILAIMRTRKMTATQVATQMVSGRNRATLYRILSGSTQDPKVSTFIDICQALDVSPIEVLQLAGMVPHQPRDSDLLDIRMRQIFRRVQDLPEAIKRLAVAQLGVIVDALWEHSRPAKARGEAPAIKDEGRG